MLITLSSIFACQATSPESADTNTLDASQQMPKLLSEFLIQFASLRDGKIEYFTSDGSEEKQLTLAEWESNPVGPGVSSNKSKLVMAAGQDSEAEIFIGNFDGSELIQISLT
ncbi:MAG TPA: hypothetical protein VGD99_22925 [Anaerolineae bacterium]